MSGSKINLTVHESSEAGGKVMDVRLRLEGAAINLRYGTEPAREKARLVRHAARGLARRAWAREQDIVSGAATGEGRMGRGSNYVIVKMIC